MKSFYRHIHAVADRYKAECAKFMSGGELMFVESEIDKARNNIFLDILTTSFRQDCLDEEESSEE